MGGLDTNSVGVAVSLEGVTELGEGRHRVEVVVMEGEKVGMLALAVIEGLRWVGVGRMDFLVLEKLGLGTGGGAGDGV